MIQNKQLVIRLEGDIYNIELRLGQHGISGHYRALDDMTYHNTPYPHPTLHIGDWGESESRTLAARAVCDDEREAVYQEVFKAVKNLRDMACNPIFDSIYNLHANK